MSVANEPEPDDDPILSKIYTVCHHSIKLIGCGPTGASLIAGVIGSGMPRQRELRDALDLISLNTSKENGLEGAIHLTTESDGASPADPTGTLLALHGQSMLRAALASAQAVFFITDLGKERTGQSSVELAALLSELGILSFGLALLRDGIKGYRFVRAENEIKLLSEYADAVIVQKTPAYQPDAVVRTIDAVAETIFESGLVNLDIADLKAIVADGGVALFGFGRTVPLEDRTQDDEEPGVVWARERALGRRGWSVSTGDRFRIAAHTPDRMQRQAEAAAEAASQKAEEEKEGEALDGERGQASWEEEKGGGRKNTPARSDRRANEKTSTSRNQAPGKEQDGTTAGTNRQDRSPTAPQYDAGGEHGPDDDGEVVTGTLTLRGTDTTVPYYIDDRFGIVLGATPPARKRDRRQEEDAFKALYRDDDRALEMVRAAAAAALNEVAAMVSPRLATGILVNVVGDEELTLEEAEYIARYIRYHVHRKTRLIWGATVEASKPSHSEGRDRLARVPNIRVFILMGLPWRFLFF